MGRGFFVTATDTGVGKTVVSAALIAALKGRGLSVCGMKPLETGCALVGDRLVPADGSFLLDVSGADEGIDEVTPCRFETPVAPMVASGLEGRDVDLPRIRAAFRGLSDRHDAVVVEGLGGLLAPIREDYSVADLALEMALPLLVVASPFLGTINHTLLTVRYAQGAGLRVAGVVLNYHRPPEGSVAERTNPDALGRLLPVPLLGVLPFMPDLGFEALLGAASANLDMEALAAYL